MHGDSNNSKDDLFKKNNSKKDKNSGKIDSRLLDPKTKTEL